MLIGRDPYRFSFVADSAQGKAGSFNGRAGEAPGRSGMKEDRRAPGADAMLAQPPAVLNRLINEPCPQPLARDVDSPVPRAYRLWLTGRLEGPLVTAQVSDSGRAKGLQSDGAYSATIGSTSSASQAFVRVRAQQAAAARISAN
jgi:hypothetical protein